MSLRNFERAMKSAADPTRLRILKMLEGGELCVCQLIAVLELSQSTVSKHLFLLKLGGLVRERREGRWVRYALDRSGAGVFAPKILGCLKGWLNDDPVIVRDRAREAVARDMGPGEVCERGMTLPERKSCGVRARGAAEGQQPAARRTG